MRPQEQSAKCKPPSATFLATLLLLSGALSLVGEATGWRIFDVPDTRHSYGFSPPFSHHKSQVLVPMSAANQPHALAYSAQQVQQPQQAAVSLPQQQPAVSIVERAASGGPPAQPASELLQSAVASAVAEATHNFVQGVVEAANSKLDVVAKPVGEPTPKDADQSTSARDASSLSEPAPMTISELTKMATTSKRIVVESAPSSPPAATELTSNPAKEQVNKNNNRQGAKSELSLSGKILDGTNASAQLAPTVEEQASGSQQASVAKAANAVEKLGQTAIKVLLLKPRKKDQLEHQQLQSKASAAEQQIINQHATSSRFHHHHQRLLPNKQADNKLVSYILSALPSDSSGTTTSTTTSNRDQASPQFLQALLSGLKSGITSRSSIVKAAISDNKLARTLSTVGKSISSNKYVAGAAVASVLAALGIAGKLLSPYLYSSSYAKLGDPMQTSGSLMQPFNVLPPNYVATEWAASGAPQHTSVDLLNQLNMQDQLAAAASAVVDTQNMYQPMSSLASHPVAYEQPARKLLKPNRYTGQPQEKDGDTNGLYTDFYNQQGLSSPETTVGGQTLNNQYSESQYSQPTSPPQQAFYQPTNTNYNVNSNYNSNPNYNLNSNSNSNYNNYNQNVNLMQPSGELSQFQETLTAASQEQPSYQQAPSPDSSSSSRTIQPYQLMENFYGEPTKVVALSSQRFGIVNSKVNRESKRRLYDLYQKQKPLQIVSSPEDFYVPPTPQATAASELAVTRTVKSSQRSQQQQQQQQVAESNESSSSSSSSTMVKMAPKVATMSQSSSKSVPLTDTSQAFVYYQANRKAPDTDHAPSPTEAADKKLIQQGQPVSYVFIRPNKQPKTNAFAANDDEPKPSSSEGLSVVAAPIELSQKGADVVGEERSSRELVVNDAPVGQDLTSSTTTTTSGEGRTGGWMSLNQMSPEGSRRDASSSSSSSSSSSQSQPIISSKGERDKRSDSIAKEQASVANQVAAFDAQDQAAASS